MSRRQNLEPRRPSAPAQVQRHFKNILKENESFSRFLVKKSHDEICCSFLGDPNCQDEFQSFFSEIINELTQDPLNFIALARWWVSSYSTRRLGGVSSRTPGPRGTLKWTGFWQDWMVWTHGNQRKARESTSKLITVTNQPTNNQPINRFDQLANYQLTNQSINQSINQPTSQPINQLTNQPTNQSNESTNQPINRLTSPTNQSINEPSAPIVPKTPGRCLDHNHNSKAQSCQGPRLSWTGDSGCVVLLLRELSMNRNE